MLENYSLDDLEAAEDLVLAAMRNSPFHEDYVLWQEGLLKLHIEMRKR